MRPLAFNYIARFRSALYLDGVTTVHGVGGVVPRDGSLHEIVVKSITTSADVEELGEAGRGRVGEGSVAGNEDDVTLDQRDRIVTVDSHIQHTLLKLEGDGLAVGTGGGSLVGHQGAHGDGSHGEVAGGLVASGHGGNEAVDAAIGVQVLRAPVLGNEVGHGGIGSQVVGAVVPVGRAASRAVDEVATGNVVRLSVDVERLKALNQGLVQANVLNLGRHEFRADLGGVSVLSNGQEQNLKTSRLDNSRQLGVGVGDLEGVDSVVRNRTAGVRVSSRFTFLQALHQVLEVYSLVTGSQTASLLTSLVGLGPELYSSLAAVEILVVRLVDVGDDTNSVRGVGVGLHQSKSAGRGVAGNRKPVHLGANLDSMSRALAKHVGLDRVRGLIENQTGVGGPLHSRVGQRSNDGERRRENCISLHGGRSSSDVGRLWTRRSNSGR
jgi:hypothetical protein